MLNEGGVDLQHLRRFAKAKELPLNVLNALADARSVAGWAQGSEEMEELFVIIGPVSSSSQDVLFESFSSLIDPVWICSIQVPLLAPTSQEQATRWTSNYWPTIYKKSNPFGPHPSIVSRAADEIYEDTKKWMRIAATAARQSKDLGIGEEIGVVIVERINGTSRAIAIAGDARWKDWPCGGAGNVTAHAALRAIAMVSDGLRIRDSGANPDAEHPLGDSIFKDSPVGIVESGQVQPVRDGYLCHELEIYCTHEPCVMCSMAIVHSRFGKVIFKNRMPRSGGFCADNELGHGLFWRKELNWTLLAWHWDTPASDSELEETDAYLNA